MKHIALRCTIVLGSLAFLAACTESPTGQTRERRGDVPPAASPRSPGERPGTPTPPPPTATPTPPGGAGR